MTATVIAEELTSTVLAFEREFRSLSDTAAQGRPAPGSWSAKEILGHLIDSAANNHQRFVRAQYSDVVDFPAYEQNAWVRVQQYDDADWEELVGLWAHYNRHLARVMRAATKESLSVPCSVGERPPVTLRFLMEDYVSHMRHHLAQIAERARRP
jgi:hypothetical protein